MATKAWYLRNRERLRAKREANKDERSSKRKAFDLENKFMALLVYSKTTQEPACSWCGNSEFCCLTIDHKADDGAARRAHEGAGSSLYYWLKRNGYPPGYQTLCFNCNCGRKRHGAGPPSNYDDFSDR